MKKSFVNCTCFVLMMVVVITSAAALNIRINAESFDLIKGIKKLYSENRRDDALVLVKTFKNSEENVRGELTEIEKQLEYGTFEKIKSAIWNGVTKGEVYDHYSGLGAITADMCLWGEIRDLVIEGYKIIYMDSNHEKQVVIIIGHWCFIVLLSYDRWSKCPCQKHGKVSQIGFKTAFRGAP